MLPKGVFLQKAEVSRETLEKYEVWQSLLLKWNARINLVAKSTLPEFWQRHALDSWQITPHLEASDRTVLDFGSGAGFPGVAAAIHIHNQGGGYVTLAESAGKKASFLRTVSRELGLPTHVHGGRIEDIEPFSADAITARAFAPLHRIFDYAEPFLAPHTKLLLLKGESVDEELELVSKTWTFESQKIESISDETGCLLIVKQLKRRQIS